MRLLEGAEGARTVALHTLPPPDELGYWYTAPAP